MQTTALKSQSAMEYLMTYGWAILIVAVVLAALFDLGVFTNLSFGNSCIAQNGFYCNDPILSSSGALYVQIQQFSQGQLDIVGFGCSNSTAAPSYYNQSYINLQPNEQSTVMFPCPTTSSALGTKFTGTLWIKYNQGTNLGLVEEFATIKAHVSAAQKYYTVVYNYGNLPAISISQLTGTASNSFNLRSNCVGIIFSPDGSKIYVNCNGPPEVFSGSGSYVGSLESSQYGQGRSGFDGFSNSGDYIYANAWDINNYIISKVDTSTLQTVSNVVVSSFPYVTSDAENIYEGQYNGNMYAINKASLSIEANVPNCFALWGIVINPTDSNVYFSCINSGGVFVMNTQTYNTIYIPSTNSGDNAFYNPVFGQNGYAYAFPYEGPNHIVVINTSTDNVVSTIPLYGNPGIDALILSPTSKVLYVLGGYNGMLGIYSINTNTNTASNSIIPISCSDCSYYGGIAITPNGRNLLVLIGSTSPNIYVVDLASGSVKYTVPVPPTSSSPVAQPMP